MNTRATTAAWTRRGTIAAATGLASSLAISATLLLAACGKSDDGRTPGQKLDAAIEKVERKADEAKARAPGAVQDVKEAARDAGATLTDAAVTVAVKAELARDTSLSALKIDVDTQGGQVLLRGSAPDEASRERATRLAAGVKGVKDVENKLVVAPAR